MSEVTECLGCQAEMERRLVPGLPLGLIKWEYPVCNSCWTELILASEEYLEMCIPDDRSLVNTESLELLVQNAFVSGAMSRMTGEKKDGEHLRMSLLMKEVLG